VRPLGLFGLVAALHAGACLPTRTERARPFDEEDAGEPGPIEVEGGVGPGDAPEVRPHAVLGIDPPHGPFSGGTLTNLRGNGFGSDARVWFGDEEVDRAHIVVRDPQRLQVTSPPGSPGPTDVIVQNGNDTSTRSRLPGGFTYDDFYLEPPTGPTAGGTIVTVRSKEPLFDDETAIEVDLSPCEVVELVSEHELSCRTPPGTPGAKRVRATVDGGDDVIDVLNAFTYVVSEDGFRGGLSGNTLDGTLNVLVLDDVTGNAVPGASVVVGADAGTATIVETDGFGTAVVSGAEVASKATVTIAKFCFQPVTFVDVPVERVTVYLKPVLSPVCGADGNPPGGGGNPGKGSSVTGEIVWPLDEELRETGWDSIPTPTREGEVKVAYVFRLTTRATDEFSLPSAINAITPDNQGETGYSFYFSTSPGNFTLYALAGIEDRSRTPYVFTPYAMGLTRGVAVGASETKRDVLLVIDVPLDHALSINASGPTPTERGPDRIQAKLAIQVGNEGYALLPNGKLSGLLPRSEPFSFVGIPPLAGTLTGARYVATASAVTGEAGGMPRSHVGLFATVTDTEPLGLGEFLELPRLEEPASSSAWNGTVLRLGRVPGGPAADLTVVDVSSGGDLVTWRIVAPGAPDEIRVPDLGALAGDVGLVRGPITIQVNAATVDSFSYGALRNRQLEPRGWRAYAQDVFFANY
jgi:hypothetical protein